MQQTFHTSLVERSLDLAAGTMVNLEAYEKWGINLAKLQALGKGFRSGWLHNVLLRVTPLNMRQLDDYAMMADLFIQSKSEALHLLTHLSKSLSHFATIAGINPHASTKFTQRPAELLNNHVELYNRVAEVLVERFNITAPAPFTGTIINAGQADADITFIRNFLKNQTKAA